MGGRSSEQWIAQYATSHQHPVNRFCHTLGIPLIVVAIAWFAIAWAVSAPLWMAVTLFITGWAPHTSTRARFDAAHVAYYFGAMLVIARASY